VCTVEALSLKLTESEKDDDGALRRKRKQGVVQRPLIIEEKQPQKPGPFEVIEASALSFEATTANELKTGFSQDSTPADSANLLSPPHLLSCPGQLNSTDPKLHGSTSALVESRLLSSTPPSGLIEKVKERNRSADNTCAMYGMLLLSACQFGQVSKWL